MKPLIRWGLVLRAGQVVGVQCRHQSPRLARHYPGKGTTFKDMNMHMKTELQKIIVDVTDAGTPKTGGGRVPDTTREGEKFGLSTWGTASSLRRFSNRVACLRAMSADDIGES